jgi:hypothetical protein
MTELADNKVQKDIADKLNAITSRVLAIESLEETIEDYKNDLSALFAEAGDKKTAAEIKMIVSVYVDAEKAKNEQEVKIDKAKLTLAKMEEIKEELSMFDRFRPDNKYDEADEIIGGITQ